MESEIDNLVEDIIKIRAINYLKKVLFIDSLFLAYDSKYEGAKIKDIIFLHRNDTIVESELSLNIVIGFESVTEGMDFFSSRTKSWLEMTVNELLESTYAYLVKKHGYTWKYGLRGT